MNKHIVQHTAKHIFAIKPYKTHTQLSADTHVMPRVRDCTVHNNNWWNKASRRHCARVKALHHTDDDRTPASFTQTHACDWHAVWHWLCPCEDQTPLVLWWHKYPSTVSYLLYSCMLFYFSDWHWCGSSGAKLVYLWVQTVIRVCFIKMWCVQRFQFTPHFLTSWEKESFVWFDFTVLNGYMNFSVIKAPIIYNNPADYM